MGYMITFLLLVGLVCAFNLVVTIGLVRKQRAAPPPDLRPVAGVGEEVGEFAAVDVDGRRLDRTDLIDRFVLFLSPGCPACEDLLPLTLERARDHDPDRLVAAVVRDADDTAVARYVARLAAVARVVVTEPDSDLAEAFALTGLPSYARVDADGRVAESGRTLPAGARA